MYLILSISKILGLVVFSIVVGILLLILITKCFKQQKTVNASLAMICRNLMMSVFVLLTTIVVLIVSTYLASYYTTISTLESILLACLILIFIIKMDPILATIYQILDFLMDL